MSIVRLTGSDGKPTVRCVTGLQWSTTNKSDWRQAKKAAKAEGLACSEVPVITGDPDTINVGTIKEDGLPSGGGHSLAAWIALAFRSGTIIAVEKVTDNEGESCYWFGAINGGQVVTGTDIVGSWEEIDAKVIEILEILSPDDAVGFLGADTGNLTANLDGESTPTNLAVTLPKSVKAKSLIRTPGQISKGALIGVSVTVLALALAVGGWVIATFISSGSDLEDLRERRTAQAQKANRDYQDLIRETEREMIASHKLDRIIDTRLGKLQAKVDGWNLETVECNDNKCSMHYKNENLTAPYVLEKGISNVCTDLTVNAEGINATCNIEINAKAPLQSSRGSADVSFFAPSESLRFRANIMAYTRYTSGASYAISPPKKIKFSGERYLTGTPVFKKGDWALNFPLSKAPIVTDLLSRHHALSLEKLSLDWGSKTINVAGSYYEKGDSQ